MSSHTSSDMEQSQKLRSLHQVDRPLDETDTLDESSLGPATPLPPPKPQHQIRNPYDKLGDPNIATSLLRRNGTQLFSVGKKYGTTSSTLSRKPSSVRRNILRLQPALFHRFKRGNTQIATTPVLMNRDRRNEFFTMKRLIFMTLGMPNTPAITSRFQTLSSKLS